MKDRSLPWDSDAEKGVLSCFFHDPNLLSREEVGEDSFYHPCNRKFFTELQEMMSAGKPVEYIGFSNWTRDRGILDAVGGPATLSEVLNFVPTAAHFSYYCGILRDKATLRKIIAVSTENIERCYEAHEDMDSLVDEVEQRSLSIRSKEKAAKSDSVKISIMETFDAIEEQMRSGGGMVGKSTGMVWVDRMTQGLKKETWFVGARPSVGKTSILLRWLLSLAVEQNVPCGVFSLEMSRDALLRRAISMLSGIPLERILSGKLQNGDTSRFHEAMSKLRNAPIWIDDRSGLTSNQIKAKTRRWYVEHGIQALFGDYLQRMGMDRKHKGNNPAEMHSSNVTEITNLGKDLGLMNVWLAQLNRQCESRTDKRPMLSEFEGTGRIEQDADMAMLLSKVKDQPEDPSYRHVLIDIAKQRNGACDSRVHSFYCPTVSFESHPVKVGR